ncbi:MAG: MFS transporter [Bacteroidota bacterium]
MEATAVTPDEKKKLWSVIAASSVGTLIEWYDFYIFGSLATIIARQFFPSTNPTAAILSTLATFAAGFVVRPFGAIVFGRLGDMAGRKYTFLVTLVLMGGSTFAIGLVPGYQTIGLAAPAIVLVLRLLQGLALGGEYGGAATYVAEHAPAARRGYYTSFIQTTATLGLFVSLGVILAVRLGMGEEAFAEWGWRIPFLLSALLVGISIYIRLRMEESPLFAKIKAEGKISKNPIRESFGKKENLRMVLIALFGAAAGQGVVWYTGQFYALSFLQNTCKVDFVQSNYLIATALVAGTPLFIFFGSWSDKVGRKFIMLAGMLLAVVLYRPIYKQMYALTHLNTKTEITAQKSLTSSITYTDTGDTVRITTVNQFYTDGTTQVTTTREKVGQPAASQTAIKLDGNNYWWMLGLIFVQIVLVTMVYGPIAAFLVELFPTRIRYTSMSLPYHIGNGIFGGLTPFIATALYEQSKTDLNPTGDPFAGLWYPIVIAAACFVVGMIFLNNKIKGDVNE